MSERDVTTALPEALAAARAAAAQWRDTSVAARARIIGAMRRLLLRDMDRMLACTAWHRPDAETLAAEILPLLDAARFLEHHAARILAPRAPLGRRPAWLMGVRAEIRREPYGVVLVLAPGNYPLFLPGVQIMQALVAGNAVCVKPAPRRAPPLDTLAALLREAGLPRGLLHVLDDSHATGEAAVRAGFDKLLLTGSARTGISVLQAAAPNLTPCTMELSGNDAVFVLPGAALDLVADCLAYGLRLNGGATCIAPHRVFVSQDQASALEAALRARLAGAPPQRMPREATERVERLLAGAGGNGVRVLAGGGPIVLAGAPVALAALTDDLFAPVMCVLAVPDMDAALAAAAASPYELGAAVFGPHAAALAFARRVRAGSVVVNDLIVPTADPRLPFGGRGRSGFGVTRGAEGLLELTVVKTVSARRGRFRPHLRSPDPGNVGATRSPNPGNNQGSMSPDPGNPGQLGALIRVVHGTGLARLRGLGALVRSVRRG